MRKKIALLVLVCMVFCSVSVYANDTARNTNSHLCTTKDGISVSRFYDADDLANYIKQNKHNKSIDLLIKEYFKNVTNNRSTKNMTGTNEDGEKNKKLKVVKIDDTTKITFYSNGMFSIGTLKIEKQSTPTDSNIVQPNSLPWTYTSAKYTDKVYNGLGVWYATASVSCSYRYNDLVVETTATPTGSVSVNSTLCSLVSKSTSKMYIGSTLNAYMLARIKTKITGSVNDIVIGVYINPDGEWDGYSEIGELN